MKIQNLIKVSLLALTLTGMTQQAFAFGGTYGGPSGGGSTGGSGCNESSGDCIDSGPVASSSDGSSYLAWSDISAWRENSSDEYTSADLTNFGSYSSPSYGSDNWENSPEHAFDNEGDNGEFVQEFALIEFDESIALEEIKISWIDNDEDADISILAYTGSEEFDVNTQLAGLTQEELLLNGWVVVSNLDIEGTGWFSIDNTSSISSQYWLVGAFSSVFNDGVSFDDCYDYFKLAAVGGTPGTPGGGGSVPVPGTLALLGLGLAALARRKKA